MVSFQSKVFLFSLVLVNVKAFQCINFYIQFSSAKKYIYSMVEKVMVSSFICAV
jgi:hypothetical protein